MSTSMSAFEFDRFLRGSGFQYMREGGKHRIYGCGGHSIAVPRGRNIKFGTVQAVKKQIRDIQGVIVAKSVSELASIEIPDSGCEPMLPAGENQTKLGDDKFALYSTILCFCQEHAGSTGTYTLREVLLFLDYQIADFNNLVSEAIDKHEIAILFDLRESLDLVKVHSLQVNDAIAEFEAMTEPPVEEPAAVAATPKPVPPASFITRKGAATVIPAKSQTTVIPGEVASISAAPASTMTVVEPPTMEYPAQAPQRKGLTKRQQAVSSIMAIFNGLDELDVDPVFRQIASFMEKD